MKKERQKQNYKGMEPSRKRILLGKKNKQKIRQIKKNCKRNEHKKYKTMDAFKKQRLLDKHADKDKEIINAGNLILDKHYLYVF